LFDPQATSRLRVNWTHPADLREVNERLAGPLFSLKREVTRLQDRKYM